MTWGYMPALGTQYVLGPQCKGAQINFKKPQLLKLRDNNEKLCKDVNLLNSYIRDKRRSCNPIADT